ncbi:unnamed protein product [Clonostachys rosea]|uniref:Zn(2)-C6 fungal-type domain-containing protein n=1 Tax=Bionectria ochroleuca TaxID=29856 RepID=A0ABY6U6L8_BIOOC|nr:unnamed protein product [Clonostachys rosea]
MTCDLCHFRKEKCVSDVDASHCQRCLRLGVRCTNKRRLQRLGRRPKVEQLPSGTCGVICFDPNGDRGSLLAASASSAAAPPTPEITPRRDEEDPAVEQALITMADSPQYPVIKSHIPITHPPWPAFYLLHDSESFYRVHRRFMMGRSFNDIFQRAIWAHLPRAKGILLKAYEVTFTTWNWEAGRRKTRTEVDASLASECLNFLRQHRFEHPRDAAALLMFSQILFVYHINIHCTSAYSIVRSAMFTAAPYYEELLLDESLDPITVTPVLIDTWEALLRRELPSVRVTSSNRLIIDRMVGLCWPLILLLQELCECSYRQKCAFPDYIDRKYAYRDVESRIRNWEPTLPDGFFDHYPPLVVDTMFFQVRLYRATSLLIIHRLQYPLGDHDEEAIALSRVISSEIIDFLSWAPEELRNLPLGLPLLVAAIEVREICMKIIPQLTVLNRNQELLSQYVKFIDIVWEVRHQEYGGLWFDLIDSIQPPVII